MRKFVKLLIMAALPPLAAMIVPFAGVAQEQKPYSGLETRGIKALSDQQVADLSAGRGAGFALSAELNGYPGPAHVLENADALMLTPNQRDLTRSLFASMKREAIPLGKRLIEQEAELDRLFATLAITPASLESATQAIGQTQASLRQTHLKYHLSMIGVLSKEQVSRYGELRGYASREGSNPHHQHVPQANE